MKRLTRRGFCRMWAWLLPLFLLSAVLPGLYAQDAPKGDPAAALRYAEWAKNAIDEGLWREALAALERAADFADVSSDISYLLALARSHEHKDRGGILRALELALAVDRWSLCRREDALLLKIDTLVALKAYPAALSELSNVSKSPAEAVLALRAHMFRPVEFRRVMAEALARYPRESEPARVFFRFLSAAAGRNPEKEDLDLLALILRRLPVLLPLDPELAWMAAPYIRDTAEAERMLAAYRAVHTPDPASIPAALKLGVINEDTALLELFAGEPRLPRRTLLPMLAYDAADSLDSVKLLDIALLVEVWELLRDESAREAFKRNLSAYTGVIIEDTDRDGIPETVVEYAEGTLRHAAYDADQDGVEDLFVRFEAGNPARAAVLLPPERSLAPGGYPLRELPPSNVPPLPEKSAEESAREFSSLPLSMITPSEIRKSADIQWERYPSVLEAEYDGAKFIPRPFELFFAPVRFEELWGSGALFPRREPRTAPLTRRTLVMQSLRVERPSREFSGGVEKVELAQGIPVRAREYAGGLMVSETDFLRGRPQIQRVDLDFDGRPDTARFFRRDYRPMELEELWDYDRDFDRVEPIIEHDVETNWDGYES